MDAGETRQQEAVTWFDKAARQNFPKAQYCLGMMYAKGRGTDRNRVEGYAWFTIAAKAGVTEAEQAMRKLKPRLSAAELEDAARRATQRHESLISGT